MFESASKYPGTFYWDFHRANLHKCLLTRALELGGKVETNARVVDVEDLDGGETATAVLADGRRFQADLVVGADGINSRLREVMVGHKDPPTPTGDLAYRLLLSTKSMLEDPELAAFVTDPQVNYWLGPDAHAGECLPRRSYLKPFLTTMTSSQLCSPRGRAFQHGITRSRRYAS